MSCPNLPAKHCSSKGSNKLAMAGHSSKLPWPKIQQFLVESIFGARSHIQSLQTWHKGFTNPMLGESVSFPMIGAGQATCCKKHQWLHSIQHQTPGVRGDRWCHGGDPGRYTPAIRPHLGGPLWTHVLRRLNIIVCSLEPWITLHQVCLKPQLLEIAVAPFKIISWWDFWTKSLRILRRSLYLHLRVGVVVGSIWKSALPSGNRTTCDCWKYQCSKQQTREDLFLLDLSS